MASMQPGSSSGFHILQSLPALLLSQPTSIVLVASMLRAYVSKHGHRIGVQSLLLGESYPFNKGIGNPQISSVRILRGQVERRPSAATG
jgi:hypothetical protein